MINLFSPGGVSSPDVTRNDPMSYDGLEQVHERQLKDFFGDNIFPDDVEQLFVAFAEIYFNPDHLEEVAIYHNYISWEDMKADILVQKFTVPNIKTTHGLAEARRMLLEDNLYRK